MEFSPLLDCRKKTALYSIVTESHLQFKNDWFLPSLKDDFDLRFKEAAQRGAGVISTLEFNACMREKVSLILQAINENWGSWFIYSDVDIQFLAPVRKELIKSLMNSDIAFQRESPTGHLCAGFFVSRANVATKKLWESVEKRLSLDESIHDQDALNEILSPSVQCKSFVDFFDYLMFSLGRHIRLLTRNSKICGPLERTFRMKLISAHNLKVSLLPTSFFGGGTFTGKLWKPGDSLPLPKKPIMHHANYTVGFENKLSQLQHVHKRVTQSEAFQE